VLRALASMGPLVRAALEALSGPAHARSSRGRGGAGGRCAL